MKLPTLWMWVFAAWLFMAVVLLRLSLEIVGAIL